MNLTPIHACNLKILKDLIRRADNVFGYVRLTADDGMYVKMVKSSLLNDALPSAKEDREQEKEEGYEIHYDVSVNERKDGSFDLFFN